MHPAVDATSDQEPQRIARAVEAPRTDYERQGYVTDDQVVRAVHKRGIGAEGHVRVRQELAETGIAIEDSGSGPDLDPVESVESSDDDAVRRYLVEIGKYRLLRPEDEITLGRRVQVGRQASDALVKPDLSEEERTELLRLQSIGREAEEQMISANLRLVVSVAKRYSKTFSMDLLDVIQEGTLGLMTAVERFDYRLGYKFSTYATWWILQGITRSIADKDRLIRLPVHVIEALRKLQRLRRRLSAAMLGAEPDPRELAVHLGWTVEKVRLLLSVAQDVTSIDARVGDEEESSLGGLLKSLTSPDPERIFADMEEQAQIDAIVDQIGGVTAEVIRLRFGIGAPEELTLQEIGDMKGVTRERIRQLESKGLGLLRQRDCGSGSQTPASAVPRVLRPRRRIPRHPNPANATPSGRIPSARSQPRRPIFSPVPSASQPVYAAARPPFCTIRSSPRFWLRFPPDGVMRWKCEMPICYAAAISIASVPTTCRMSIMRGPGCRRSGSNWRCGDRTRPI